MLFTRMFFSFGLVASALCGSVIADDTIEQDDTLIINGCRIEPGTQCPGVDLAGADLSNADLSEAVLSGANLQGVVLRHAKLGNANLAGAQLMQADLARADLRHANLRGSDMTGANLEAVNGWAAFFQAKIDSLTRSRSKSNSKESLLSLH